MSGDARVAVRFPLTIETDLPVDAHRDFSPGQKALDKATDVFDDAHEQIVAFLVHMKDELAKDLNPNSLTISCGLSVTLGVTWGVELSATGDISMDVTWEKPRNGVWP